MIHWIIDEILSERQYETGFPTLPEAVRNAGHMVHLTKYVPFSDSPSIQVDHLKPGAVVTHGCIQFCKQIEKHYGRLLTPGMYFNDNVKSFAKFSHHIGEDLLNDDFYIIPWAEVVRRRITGVFVKPLSGLKDFVGQVIKNCDYDISPNNPIDPDCLCVVSSPKEIIAEFRYVIVEKKVITGSEYRWDNILDVRCDTHPTCDMLAHKIADAEWQADTVYVCDVALINVEGWETAKVVELNAFSSSGLYACDTNNIVEAVSRAAEKEYYGDE
jgi:hypothetical protein